MTGGAFLLIGEAEQHILSANRLLEPFTERSFHSNIHPHLQQRLKASTDLGMAFELLMKALVEIEGGTFETTHNCLDNYSKLTKLKDYLDEIINSFGYNNVKAFLSNLIYEYLCDPSIKYFKRKIQTDPIRADFLQINRMKLLIQLAIAIGIFAIKEGKKVKEADIAYIPDSWNIMGIDPEFCCEIVRLSYPRHQREG